MGSEPQPRERGRESPARARVWALVGLLTACAPAVERSSVLVLTLDTLRADVLGCYGSTDGGGALTPNLDRLAARGLRCEWAYATVPLTLPSHASMWTGLYPPRHSVRDNGLWPLPREARTAAELAQAAGVQTAAFVAAVVLDDSFGLEQGFDVYRQPEREALKAENTIEALPAGEMVERALAWFDGRDPGRPYLAWVHFYDPHDPAPEPDAALIGADRMDADRLSAPERELWAGYLPQVETLDREIGRLLAALEEHGALTNTTILVVGDHGEALGEHGEVSHGSQCFEAVMRVPLLVCPPDPSAGGRVIESVCSVADVLPTVLEALGLEVPPGLDGRSLLAPDLAADRGVYLESYHGHLSYGWSHLAGWVDAGGKYLHGSRPRLFDPRADPGERVDRLMDPGGAARARPYLEALRRLESLPRLQPDLADTADAELLAQIEALGYASVPGVRAELPEPSEDSMGLDPLGGIALERRTVRAMKLNDAGQWDEAERLLESILAENPTNHVARDQLAMVWIRRGEHGRAAKLLEALLAEGPRWAHSSFNLGVCRLETGELAAGVEALRQAVEADAAQAGDVWALVERYRRTGRGELARELEAGLLGAGLARP